MKIYKGQLKLSFFKEQRRLQTEIYNLKTENIELKQQAQTFINQIKLHAVQTTELQKVNTENLKMHQFLLPFSSMQLKLESTVNEYQ